MTVAELLARRSGFALVVMVLLVTVRGVLRLVAGPVAVVLVVLEVTAAGIERAAAAVPERPPRLRMVRVDPTGR